ncbi:unnamed protein product [Paramecium octaurelia]|uniref:Uncharacterized protein n=1 Tax=Paramecium octaurelia TaxID=43137 RepID=A0A8S1VBL3_PAROT|nr:unnamed protein product [Paramecium octaurelia]
MIIFRSQNQRRRQNSRTMTNSPETYQRRLSHKTISSSQNEIQNQQRQKRLSRKTQKFSSFVLFQLSQFFNIS